MFTSFLNLISSQQPASGEITGTILSSPFQSNSHAGMKLISSENDFALQLSQFRQLMQTVSPETGKNLPGFEDSSQIPIDKKLVKEFSRLQLIFDNLDNLLKHDGPMENLTTSQEQESTRFLNLDLQSLLDSIAANLDQLKNISVENSYGLNEQQIGKLNEAIESIHHRFGSISSVISELDSLPAESSKVNLRVAELLADTNKAIERANRAMFTTKPVATVQLEQNSTPQTKLTSFTVKNSDSTLNSDSYGQSTKPTSEQGLLGMTKPNISGDEESLAVQRVKSHLDNLDGKSLSNSKIAEPKLASGTELEMSTVENKPMLASAVLKSTSGFLAVNNSAVKSESSFNIGTLANIPNLTAGSVDNVASVTPVVTETSFSQNPQTAQLTSQSSIQQGLSLRSDFSPNLALRIQWIFQQALSSAEIMMDPPELGPLSVKMQHRGGETNIIFQVNNQQTKEMIEENLPKLKELLQEQGIALGDTQVNQNQQQKEQPQPENSLIASEDEISDSEVVLSSRSVDDAGRVAILDAYI